MKTQIIRISLLIIIPFLSAFLIAKCEEKHDDCYVCTVTTTWFFDNHTTTCERLYPYCGVDEQWIKNFEKINTYTDTLNRMVQTCKCK